MANLIFLAHIPLLRIEPEEVSFGKGSLWKLPFEVYDQLTAGAFTGQRKQYETTQPVFYRMDGELELPFLADRDEPINGVAELKIPSDNWAMLHGLDLGFIFGFHEIFADRAWMALLLSAASSALPQPRFSTTFVASNDKATFKLGETVCQTIRVQGDADHEYAFLPEVTSSPLSSETIEQANSLFELIETALENSELAAALHRLTGTSAPSLSPSQQLTLSVIALEALLLPEVRSGLGATFSRRIAALLASDAEHHRSLEQIARQLYDIRSAGLHGGAPRLPEEAAQATTNGYGQQLLAAAIIAFAKRLTSNTNLHELLLSLDGDSQSHAGSGSLTPLDNPPGRSQPQRLGRAYFSFSVGLSSASDMSTQEGGFLSWCPLVGLGATALGENEPIPFDLPNGPMILPMTGSEVVSMEDKDIRRDFAAQLHVRSFPVAGIAAAIRPDEVADLQIEIYRAAAQLGAKRNQAVLALRLAGFKAFLDPELLGEFVYEGKGRCRRYSVLRQTLLTMMRVEPQEQIVVADAQRIHDLWCLLEKYKTTAWNHEVDQVLEMFRRSFDRRFLPVQARAGLMLGALEAMFGRFRSPKDRVQLSALVAQIPNADPEAVEWFEKSGRQFRNAMAHGSLNMEEDVDEPLEHLSKILSGAVPAFLRTWLEAVDRETRRPGSLFIDCLTRQITEAGK